MLDSFKTLFTREQVEGFVRHGLTTIGGAIFGTGVMIDNALWQAILGALVTGAGVLWSWWVKRPAKLPTPNSGLPQPPANP